MSYDARIILGVNPVDVAGSMSRGNQLAAETMQIRDQNALRDVYRTQGAGLLQGNQQSLNALAALDPTTAMSLQNSFTQGQEATRRIEIMNAEERRAIAEAAAKMDERQKADALRAAQQEVLKFVMAPDEATFNQMVTQAGKPELVGMFGQRQRLGALYMDDFQKAFETAVGPAVDPAALTEGAPAGKMWVDPNNRALGVKDLPGAAKPEAPYTAIGKLKRDLQNGEISQSEYEAGVAALAPKGSVLTVDPTTGAVTFTQGAGVGGAGDQPNVGDVYNPAAASDAVNLVNDILGVGADGNITAESQKVIERITGAWEGGGGNDIDAMSGFRRGWYGDAGLDKIEKLNQLQSKAWLAARDMLKGGGPITDYESKKAEAAVARLSRAKGSKEFIAALTELRDAIQAGEAKLRAAGKIPADTPQATGEISDEELMQQLLGGN